MLELQRFVAESFKPDGFQAAPPNAWYVRELELLVDTGVADPEFRGQLIASCLRISQICITHLHPDHVGNLIELQSTTGAKVCGPILLRDFSPQIATVWTPDCDGCTVLQTPGHAADHIGLLLPDGTFCAGDTVLGVGTPWIGPPEGDLSTYLGTLEMLAEVLPDGSRLAAGHGPVADDARQIVRRTLAHRLMRERMVQQALNLGMTEERLVADWIYNQKEKLGLSGLQFEMAVWTVRGHLQRLSDQQEHSTQ